MSPLNGLSSDILVDILTSLDSLSDLRCTILSSRAFLGAFHTRRALILTTVFRSEVRLQDIRPNGAIIRDAKAVADRCNASFPRDAIAIYEAIRPMMRYSISQSESYISRTLKLHLLYLRCGPEFHDRDLALLERAYTGMLRQKTNFALDNIDDRISASESSAALGGRRAHLSASCQAVARSLAKVYERCKWYRDCLAVQQQTYRRIPLDQPSSYALAADIMSTYGNLNDSVGAIHFCQHMYRICRGDQLTTPMLTWARHLIAEYERVGRSDDALAEQQRVLDDLPSGRAEYIAWARVLINKHKRIGQNERAFSLKADVWNVIHVGDACYFGWARELADEYRRVGHVQKALEIVQRMYEATQHELARNEKDVGMQFHARQAAQALAGEYQANKRIAEAHTLKPEIHSR